MAFRQPTRPSRHHATARQQRPRLFSYQRPQAPLGAVFSNSGSPGGPCLDVTWLKRNLEDVRVYDARGRISEPNEGPVRGCSADYDAYLEGHIPGAVFVSWVRDGASWTLREHAGSIPTSLSSPSSGNSSSSGGGGAGGGGAELEPQRALTVVVDPEEYVPCFEARGLSAERPVVVYDNGTSMIAARVWWQLLLYGHPSPYVLHGGWEAWRAAGGGSELYEPCPLKLSSVYDAEPQLRYRATVEEFQLAGSRGEADGGGGEPTVAVLLLPYETKSADGASNHHHHDGLPLARRLSFSSLLHACAETSSNGVINSSGHHSPPQWTAVAASGGRAEGRDALAAQLGGGLGVAVGRGSPARLLLASPFDSGLSACAAAALLSAAGHERWAVCEAL